MLCSRIAEGDVKGEVKFNNSIISKDHRHKRFSYVPQQDHLLNTATIRETLETAAMLRSFPEMMASEERLKTEIDEILSDMGLSHRENFMIGGSDVRGISGGEKRRVSIAQVSALGGRSGSPLLYKLIE